MLGLLWMQTKGRRPMNEQEMRLLEVRLGKTLVNLLGASPPGLRGMIKAKTDIWVPESVSDIRAYLLENLPKAPIAITDEREIYNLEASFERRTTGRCSYVENEILAGTVPISSRRLRRIVEDSDDASEAMAAMGEVVIEIESFEVSHSDGPEYDGHEIMEAEDGCPYNTNFNTILAQFMAANPGVRFAGDPDPDEDEDEVEDDAEAENPIPFREDVC